LPSKHEERGREGQEDRKGGMGWNVRKKENCVGKEYLGKMDSRGCDVFMER